MIGGILGEAALPSVRWTGQMTKQPVHAGAQVRKKKYKTKAFVRSRPPPNPGELPGQMPQIS